jgi:hypothetical protein
MNSWVVALPAEAVAVELAGELGKVVELELARFHHRRAEPRV